VEQAGIKMPELQAVSAKNNVILAFRFPASQVFALERRKNNGPWVEIASGISGHYADYDVGIYQYRCYDDPVANLEYLAFHRARYCHSVVSFG
jgi:hypothetical protein